MYESGNVVAVATGVNFTADSDFETKLIVMVSVIDKAITEAFTSIIMSITVFIATESLNMT